ncbi:hypothetical protein TNCV_2870771 [Trichonephila clavipes]|nr:hypothetical protein TNCV_2870771 [Trichonephila clavipes]
MSQGKPKKKENAAESVFPPRSEISFKKICLENRVASTKVIKSQLQDINVNDSERTVGRKLKDLHFKTCRPTRKSKLTRATKAKRLNWAKHWRDKDVYLWRSLLERIIHVRNHHPQMQETVQSCIDSMRRRIAALIAAKGGSTKY